MSGSIVIETGGQNPVRRETNEAPIGLENSGFPFDDSDFDRDRNRDYSLESQLDDIAKRHPEFAEHLSLGGSFPRATRRNTPTSASSTSNYQPEFRRRPFGSRYEGFGFPFDRYFEEQEPEEFYRETSRPHQQSQQQTSDVKVPPQPEPQECKQQQTQATQTDTTERIDEHPRNIQQSNTIDLGQKQEPIVDERTQRSMSAPPENHPPRFVSSINIPINRDGSGDNMGARMSTQESQTHHQNKPAERVIPIHVEGRDEPVIPKNINSTFTSPQPERLFGHPPSHFSQFVSPEEKFRQQQQYQKPQQFQKQNVPPTQQHQPEHSTTFVPPPMQQPQQQQPQQQQQSQQQFQEEEQPQQAAPQQQQQKPSPLDLIQLIQKDVLALMTQVENFEGKPKDKEYLYLDEMLTRNLIKLDNIETEGKDNIRQARKEAIKCIESCIGILDAKANANQVAANENKMEIEQKPAENTTNEPATLEVSGVAKPGAVVENPNTNEKETGMEVASTTEEPNKQPSEETPSEKKETTEQEKVEGDKNNAMEVVNDESSTKLQEENSASQNKEENQTENDKKDKKKGKKKEKSEEK